MLSFLATSSLMASVACAVFGCAAGGLDALRWAVAPEAIDEARADMNQYNGTANMAIFSLSIKSPIGIASLVVGGPYHYPAILRA